MNIWLSNQVIHLVSHDPHPSPAEVREARPFCMNIFHERMGMHKVRHALPPLSHATIRRAMPKDGSSTLQSGHKGNIGHPAWGLPEIHGVNHGGRQTSRSLPSTSYKKTARKLMLVFKAKLQTRGFNQRSITLGYCGFRFRLSILGNLSLRVWTLSIEYNIKAPQHASATLHININMPLKTYARILGPTRLDDDFRRT